MMIHHRVSGNLDLSLADLRENRRIAQEFLAADYDVLLESSVALLCHSGNLSNGSVFLYNKDAAIIEHFVQFERLDEHVLGKDVIQLKVWRAGRTSIDDMTRTVLFDHFLAKHEGIVSDADQTPDSERFWISVMGRAANRKMRVGLIDAGGTAQTYDEERFPVLDEWIRLVRAAGCRFFVLAS